MHIISKEIKKLPYGKIIIPPSKSISHRAVICALLSNTSLNEIKNLGKSNDIVATINGMNAILKKKNPIIDCNESGSTLRFLIPIAAAMNNTKITFIGRGKLLSRPMGVYEEIFKKQNLLWNQTKNKISIQGKLKADKFFIRGDISSQFITGLFFALPLLSGDSEIIITTNLESIDYINLTIDVLNSFGIKIAKTKSGYKIKGSQNYKKNKYTVEGDYTQASYFLVAKYLGCNVDVLGLNQNSAQGDKQIINIIKSIKNNKSIVVDAKNIPDLVPAIAVLMCFLKGKSKIINASRVRLKECDRLHAMATELNKIGGNVIEKKDSLIISGVNKLNGGIVETWGDHRIAMAMAICKIKCLNPLIIKEPDVVKKSYPNFWKDFEKKNMNKWGNNIKISVYGTSHGAKIGVTIKNIPKGIKIDYEQLKTEMNRRRPGYSNLVTPRKEPDEFQITSGLTNKITNGKPIIMYIKNTNVKSQDYSSILRPGHADWSAYLKYGKILPGGGQFSARLTAPIVFAGAIAKQIIAKKGICITAKISSIGDITNPTKKQIEDIIGKIKSENDSVGATISVVVNGVPKALGSDYFGGIEAKLSSLYFSIPAVKGIEFGDGFMLSKQKGSSTNDAIYYDKVKKILFSKTNHMGGILGGISNGMPIIARLAFKPTASIGIKQKSVDIKTMKETTLIVGGRHDPCVALRAPVIVETYTALALLDLILENEK